MCSSTWNCGLTEGRGSCSVVTVLTKEIDVQGQRLQIGTVHSLRDRISKQLSTRRKTICCGIQRATIDRGRESPLMDVTIVHKYV